MVDDVKVEDKITDIKVDVKKDKSDNPVQTPTIDSSCKKGGFWKGFLLSAGIIVLCVACILGGIYYATNKNQATYNNTTNAMVSTYNNNLNITAHNSFDYGVQQGYLASVSTLYKDLSSCNVVTVTDPSTNSTVKIQDIKCGGNSSAAHNSSS